MPRKAAQRMIRVDDDISAKMEKYATQLGWSFNQFGERAIAAICDMVEENPRRVPTLIRQIDVTQQIGPAITEQEQQDLGSVTSLPLAAEDPMPFKYPKSRKHSAG